MNSILYPDYTNCGLNVTSSVMNHLGVFSPIMTHPDVDALLNGREYRNIVLMLFDGMGMDALERHCRPDGFFRSHLVREMRAVYPSTTTNATTSIECGRSPKEHGWLGWTLYFEQIDRYVDIFPNTCHGVPAADYHVAQRFLPRRFIFDDITSAGRASAHCISPYSDDIKVTSLMELMDAVERKCREDGRHYLYTYWPEPDHTMHEAGVDKDIIRNIILSLEQDTERMAQSLPEDTLVLITADHGLIDVDYLYVEDHPEIMDTLVRDTAIEQRAAAFYIKPDRLGDFPGLFKQAFGDRFLLIDSESFISRFLGPGEPHPCLRNLVGDYMALAKGRESLCMRRGDAHLTAAHAGLTAQEMRVPLIGLSL